MKFIKSLTFRICILITLIEVIFFIFLGVFYSIKYVNKLESGLESDISMPGKLISEGRLDYDSITNTSVIEDIIGFRPLEAYIIGINMNIFYSLDPNMTGLSVDEIPTLKKEMFKISSPETIIIDSIIEGISSKTCITPVYAFDNATPKLFTYIRIDSENIKQERLSIVCSFVLGFLFCIIFTNLTVVIIFRIYIYKRIDESLVVMEKVESGNLNARLMTSNHLDEMNSLQNGINSMISNLEKKVSDLNSEILNRKKQESEKESILLALTQSAKMAELGALSAGIAHEFKNPISGISMTLQNMSMRLFNTKLLKNIEAAEEYNLSLDDIEKYLKSRNIDGMISTIEGITTNMNEIISNMLSYSRKNNNPYTLHDIKNIIDEVLVLAKFNQEFRRIVEVKVVSEENIPKIVCSKNEIIQVFLNVLANSSEALLGYLDGGEGFNSQIVVDIVFISGNIVVRIKDNGPGIDENIKNKIFEPFYTTKVSGEGTGLGLYICKLIVEEKHGGDISIENNIESGAIIKITLPIKQKRQLNMN